MSELKNYTVECRGDVREVYVIEATSEADAMARVLEDGSLVNSEASSVEAVSARLDED